MKPRIQPAEEIRAEFVAGTARGSGTLLDLSADGLFVRTPLLPRSGPVAMVLFTPRGNEVRVAGLVRWNTARTSFRATGFGVRLTASGADYSALLESAQSRARGATRSRSRAAPPGSGSPRR
jgi:hypothetical protein